MTKEELLNEIMQPQYFVCHWLGNEIYYNPKIDKGVWTPGGAIQGYDVLCDFLEYSGISMNKDYYSVIAKLDIIRKEAGLN